MLRILIGGLLGAVVLFVWGSVSWLLIGWHETNGYRLPDEPAVRQVLTSTIASDSGPGVYWFPAMPQADEGTGKVPQAEMDAWAARHLEGPIGALIYRPQGYDAMSPGMFVKGFVIYLLGTLLACCLLASARIGAYGGRVLFVTALGLFLVFTSDLTLWNYMYFPNDWTLVNAADHLIGWAMAGLVIGAVVKGTARPATSE